MMLIEMVFEVLYSFCVIFITCEMNQQLTNDYEDIEYVIGQFDWYLLPADVQRILPIIVINAQQAVNIQCFGSTNANRESFQKVREKRCGKKVERFMLNLIDLMKYFRKFVCRWSILGTRTSQWFANFIEIYKMSTGTKIMFAITFCLIYCTFSIWNPWTHYENKRTTAWFSLSQVFSFQAFR